MCAASPSLSPALASFLDALHCPVCRARLRPVRGALRCPAGHTYDIARQGYVSLLTGARATSGDDAAMVAARARVLATGRYEPVRRESVRLAADAPAGDGGAVVEVGCGTGHYLRGVLEQLPGARGLGLDTSVRALRSAARAHERAAAASWDVYRPFPLDDRSVDVVLDVFAPRNPAEFHRILRASGRLIVVRPTDRHLAELRAHVPEMVSVEPGKEQRLARSLGPYFTPVDTRHIEYTTPLTPQQAADLIAMTPSAHHLNPSTLTGHPHLPDETTISALATSYLPR
ncbi:methyltransferase [Streptomyces triticagri]|uniref:Methyltransferase n=1 Tax=Streptomyces triticagri TaxID=2293568 RepID=A0A372M4U0_9ACTN|nr:methyltransferase [Streptomyces triticagri]RFU85944.1 methyltransferase [Streptomyces triticagri]